MRRRDLLRSVVTGGLASLVLPTELLGHVENPASGVVQRSPLRQEADFTYAVERFDLALNLYNEVLKEYRSCGAASSEALADAAFYIERCESDLSASRSRLDQQRQFLQDDPEYTCSHYELGLTLWHIGRDGEALAEFRKALKCRTFGEPCDHCSGYSLNNIGCYYLVRDEYETALEWFRRGCGKPDKFQSELAMLNMILTLVEMGTTGEATRVIHQYLKQFGRLPWLHREVLKGAGIDADRLFLNIRGAGLAPIS